MPDDSAALEQRLLEGYREQLRYYERALQCAEHPTGAPDLLAVLDVIAQADARIAEAKAAWRLSGRSPGQELSEVLGRIADRIRALADCVDRRIVQTQMSKQELLPEMDAIIRQRRMLHAYGGS